MYTHLKHTLPAIYNNESKIIILGSFPSVKSRENNFYYGNPNNRFFKVLEKIYKIDELKSNEEKKAFLLKEKIALWDVIAECDIKGSSDSSIKNVKVNDINKIIKNSKIARIYANGNLSKSLYDKYLKSEIGIDIIPLPSTSPANATYNLEKLVNKWRIIKY